jgi:membrane-associated phospholipid phosphatase
MLAADAVLTWNQVLRDAVRTARASPLLAARNMAIVGVAVFEAVNSIDRGYEPYSRMVKVPRSASLEAAADAAAYRALVGLYPNQVAIFDAALQTSLASIPDGPSKDKGIEAGFAAAEQTLALRADDGSGTVVTYTSSPDPGRWRPTPPAFAAPLLPQWPRVTPFAMRSGSQFRPAPPPSLTSVEYAMAFDEVKDLGGDGINTPTRRTAEQTEIARFWLDGAGTASLVGHWNAIAEGVAQQRGNSLVENARLFAMLNIAMADAYISSWDAKYAYDFWRPITAIREAGTDANPSTEAETNWTPLLVTPPMPSYTSGHSTVGSAAAAVLSDLFGPDVPFTSTSEGLPGVTRTFDGFSAAAAEVARSRLYGGIHFDFDNRVGLAAGGSLGHYVSENLLERSGNRSSHGSSRDIVSARATRVIHGHAVPSVGHSTWRVGYTPLDPRSRWSLR